MKVLGIITEYNPFHNGHLFHLEESKRVTNSDYCVAVMSGNFIQRGQPALVDKWSRAKMAVLSGVDLVIELPVTYAVQTAELFAYGSIKILDNLQIVDNICFGSESGNLDILDKISSILINEPLKYKNLLKVNLNEGITFASARSKALSHILGSNIENILNSSNNILGIEYLKALKRLNSTMKPYTLPRVSNKYNSKELTGNISSATSIRNTLQSDCNLDLIKSSVPYTTLTILKENFYNGIGPIFTKNFEKEIISTIRKMSINEIKNIFDVEEGLENRIKTASMKTSNIDDLIKLVKTKRYTQTRIQRILIHIILGISKNYYIDYVQKGGPQYIRVLAFNDKGRELLNKARKISTLPIITKLKHLKKYNNEVLETMLQLDITATNIYNLSYKNPEYSIGDIDYTNKVLYLK